MTHPLPNEANQSPWTDETAVDENPLPISAVPVDPAESGGWNEPWQPALAGLVDLVVDFIFAVPATLEIGIAHLKQQFSCERVVQTDLTCNEPAEEGRLPFFTEPYNE
ncbi:hypothetical protein MOKP64_45000 [Mycobacterium avium subsp. hominissuis]